MPTAPDFSNDNFACVGLEQSDFCNRCYFCFRCLQCSDCEECVECTRCSFCINCHGLIGASFRINNESVNPDTFFAVSNFSLDSAHLRKITKKKCIDADAIQNDNAFATSDKMFVRHIKNMLKAANYENKVIYIYSMYGAYRVNKIKNENQKDINLKMRIQDIKEIGRDLFSRGNFLIITGRFPPNRAVFSVRKLSTKNVDNMIN